MSSEPLSWSKTDCAGPSHPCDEREGYSFQAGELQIVYKFLDYVTITAARAYDSAICEEYLGLALVKHPDFSDVLNRDD